jgi:hypothetical protein
MSKEIILFPASFYHETYMIYEDVVNWLKEYNLYNTTARRITVNKQLYLAFKNEKDITLWCLTHPSHITNFVLLNYSDIE